MSISFSCFRRFLVVFNVLFLLLGLLIATLPVYFHIQKLLKSWPINGAIVALGVFLVIVAIFGCYGSMRQHQVALFFYMVVLSLICMLTFAFSVATLSLNKSQQQTVLTHGWNTLSNQTKGEIQQFGDCCGWTNSSASSDHPSCVSLPCVKTNSCQSCLEVMKGDAFSSFRQSTGGVALFVSCLMCISVYLTSRYRHYKNPKDRADQYL